MARFTSIMLSALVCALAITYTATAAYADDMSSSGGTDMAPVNAYPSGNETVTAPPVANMTSSTGSASGDASSSASHGYDEHHEQDHKHEEHQAVTLPAYDGDNQGENHNEKQHNDIAKHYDQAGTDDNDHKSSHQSSHVEWIEPSHDDHSASDDCHHSDDADCSEDKAHHADSSDSNASNTHKKIDWRDVIEEKYQPAAEEIYNDAKAVLHKWGLLSVKSAASSNNDDRSSRYGGSKDDYNTGSNSYDDCELNEFEYSSRSCKAYGMFDDSKYNETQTAYARSKGLMAMSEPMYLSKSEVNGRTLGQLGVHFAMCEDYNKKSGAQFRVGLYEKQRSSGRSSSWGSKPETWSLVAKTDLQKFNRRGNEYGMFSVDANSTIALKPNTYYTIITTIAPGSALTMFTDNADSRAFSSFDFAGTSNNLPKSWDGKKSRNWSPVSMELAMCRTKK